MTLETFRTVLLATLVILLVYVLYKRLLTLLGKKKKNESYATVKSWKYNKTNNELDITVLVPIVGNIKLDVYDDNGKLILQSDRGSLTKGTHTITEKITPGGKGKHYYKVISPNHEISQYFDVN
jgi:hypothetical protein